MTSGNWEKAYFHEGCLGYGHDDAVLLNAVMKAGIVVDTVGGNLIWHMSHEGKGLTDGERKDHWNKSNFNPANPGNERFLKDPVYDSPYWGMPGDDKRTYLVDVRGNFPRGINRFLELNGARLRGRRVIALVPCEFDMGPLMGLRCRVCDGRFVVPEKDVVLVGPDELVG